MDTPSFADKIRGSLVGGAIGDALGYPVEFISRTAILNSYGPDGITSFSLSDGVAQISDDTQMTLFTAVGMMCGLTQRQMSGDMGTDLLRFVRDAYIDWYHTQRFAGKHKPGLCWIRHIQQLNSLRAPGNTCLSALSDPYSTNNSKGCGGIMRVAPVAMLSASETISGRGVWNADMVSNLAARCARITHHHPLGYIPAAIFADIIFNILLHDGKLSKETLLVFIRESLFCAKSTFVGKNERLYCEGLEELLERSIKLSDGTVSDADAIYLLGEGWVAEETLAISLFCALRHFDDFKGAVVAAVNHSGDSDSTGAVCGNIIGAICGFDNLNFPGTDNLELYDLLLDIADDIVSGCPTDSSDPRMQKWRQRYFVSAL